jgi:hypothetical protein
MIGCKLSRRFSVKPLQFMKALANIGCWLFVVPLVLGTIAHGLWVWHFWGHYQSANGYIDPAVFIMNYLVPVGSLGVIGLFILRRYRMASRRSVTLAAVLFLVFTIALVTFGVWHNHGLNDEVFRMSYQVWWLKPFKLFGI